MKKGIEHTYTAEQLTLLMQHNVTSAADRRAKAAYASFHEALGAEADRLCAGMTMLVRTYERADSSTKGNRTDVTLCVPELAGQEQRIRERSLIMFYRLVVAPDMAAFRAMSAQDRQNRFMRFKQECAGKAADEPKQQPCRQPKRQKPSKEEVNERNSAEDAELIWDVWAEAIRYTVPLYLADVQLLHVGPTGLVQPRCKPCVEIHEVEEDDEDAFETEDTSEEDATEDGTETEDDD